MKSILIPLLLLISTSFIVAQNISVQAAHEDLAEFSRLLRTESSYFQISDIDIDGLINQKLEELNQLDSIPAIELTFFVQELMAKIKDSHASIKYLDFDRNTAFQYRKRFPFPLAPFEDKVLALELTKERGKYRYFNAAYPYLKTVNGKEIHSFLSYYSFDNNRFPEPARTKRGLDDLRRIGNLYTRKLEVVPDPLHIVLSNGVKDTSILVNTFSKNSSWRYLGDLGNLPIRGLMKAKDPFRYEDLILDLDDSVAYLMIPKMIGYDDYPDFELFFEKYLKSLKSTQPKGLILDIRGNSGGSRDLIYTLSKFITPVKQAPWVANMAYVRSDQRLDEDIETMIGKRLYNYDSAFFEDKDRKAIDQFLNDVQLKYQFDESKFSQPYFMVLNHHDSLFLDIPIYILCDEGSFSAASIMASVFKGLENVKICGTRPNGSSGRSKYFRLSNANIQVKLSTMLSFQRNGLPLDGYGTEPDIIIERDELQILGNQDTQRLKLIEMVKTKKD